MDMDSYIIAGPCQIGTVFGYSGQDLPAGKFAVVTDGEYTDGGTGPSSVCGHIHRTREGAERCLAATRECSHDI